MFYLKNGIKIIAFLFIVVGAGSIFMENLYFNELEKLPIIGIFLWLLSTRLPDPLTDKHQLENNIASDIVTGNTIWKSIAITSSNFRISKLIEDDNGDIKIRSTVRSFFFDLLLIIIGLVSSLFVFVLAVALLDSFLKLFSIIPVIIFFFILKSIKNIFPKKIASFNRNKALFWKEGIESDYRYQDKLVNGKLPFFKIYGLQLLKVHHSSKTIHSISKSSTSFNSYELNLILHNGQRINLMANGDKAAAILEAKKLARYLSKKIWHKL